jgi:hypothetical protein
MKRIIICEGKTDAILLSYFLIKKYGWQYEKKEDTRLKKDIGFQIENDNEELNWYIHTGKPNQELAIWGVGGIGNISQKLEEAIDRTRREGRFPDNRFEKIILFFDRDKRTNDECLDNVKKWLKNKISIKQIEFEKWMENEIKLFNDEQYTIKIMVIVYPEKDLETFLAESLKNQTKHDGHLVDEARYFINNVSKIPSLPYLYKERYESKACLGSILSVISPDWVFSELDKRLKLVEWERLELTSPVYSLLAEL